MQNFSISSSEFERLKEFFDKNNCYDGAAYLEELLQKPIQAWATTDPYNANSESKNGYNSTGLPFVIGDGLEWRKDYSTNRLRLELNPHPSYVEHITKTELDDLRNEVASLRMELQELQKMHTENGDHVPTIISTREQAEALKDKISREERVLLNTSFDNALKFLQ